MDKERTLFFGFVICFALMLTPIPDFTFWDGMPGFLDFVFHKLAFVLGVVFAIPMLWRAVRRLFNR